MEWSTYRSVINLERNKHFCITIIQELSTVLSEQSSSFNTRFWFATIIQDILQMLFVNVLLTFNVDINKSYLLMSRRVLFVEKYDKLLPC